MRFFSLLHSMSGQGRIEYLWFLGAYNITSLVPLMKNILEGYLISLQWQKFDECEGIFGVNPYQVVRAT